MEWQLKQEGVPLFTEDVLRNAVEQGAADIFLIPGMPLSWKVGGKIMYQSDEKIFPKEIEEMVREIYALANNRSMDHVVECGDDDFAMALLGVSRFRVNVFRQRGSLAAIIRVITFDLPDFRNLNIPQVAVSYTHLSPEVVRAFLPRPSPCFPTCATLRQMTAWRTGMTPTAAAAAAARGVAAAKTQNHKGKKTALNGGNTCLLYTSRCV